MSGVLSGKVVIVTGAGRGVGAEIARLAAREGAKVVVNDLGVSQAGEGGTLGPAEEVVDAIRACGREAMADGSNVATWDGAHTLFANAMKVYGDVDAIVNNAGILRDTIFHKMSEAEWDAVLAVNLKGCFNVARAAAPHFKERQKGAFVHMTSTSGLIGNFGQANYAAAKMGVAGLSKAIALDMQKFGVRSNAVAPFAWTRMVDSIPDETPEQKRRGEGLKKLVPEKIAPFVTALCSDAAAHVTGQIFGVRNNEIYLFSQPRPFRTAHTSDGWTPETVIDRVFPAFANDFYPLHRSGDVFTWDPA